MSDILPFSGLAHSDHHTTPDPAHTPPPRITNLLVEMSNGALFVVSADDILEGKISADPLHLDDAVFYLIFSAHRRNLIPRTKQQA